MSAEELRKLMEELDDTLAQGPQLGGCPFCGRDPFHRTDFGEPVGIVCCDPAVWLRGDSEEDEEIREVVKTLICDRAELRTALGAAVNALPELLALKERVAELEAALKPFAGLGGGLVENARPGEELTFRLHAATIRMARAALKGPTQ